MLLKTNDEIEKAELPQSAGIIPPTTEPIPIPTQTKTFELMALF